MQTIVIAASRPVDMSDVAMMAGIAVVVVLVAWQLFAGIRRHRHQPHA
ncbi:MAG: hypothetical protein ACRETG_02955 [Steroidobacteraceae bacterium]